MRVSVVICTHATDRYDDFREAVNSVLAQSYDPIELVLVIDGNPSVYERAVEDFGSGGANIIHDNEENHGVSYSRTKGATLASGDVVAFIDDDAIAAETWVAELVSAYHENDAIAVGGRMDGDWVAGRPWFLPREFDWLVGVTHPGFATKNEEVRNTFESNLSFCRRVFLDLDGFDDRLGPDADSYSHSEGAELGIRLQDKYNRGVVYNADAVVRHKVFKYRTRLQWLLSRAFAQGVAKHRLNQDKTVSESEESAYLSNLFFNHVPIRIKRISQQPSLAAIAQLVMIFVLTATVGCGYLVSLLREIELTN